MSQETNKQALKDTNGSLTSEDQALLFCIGAQKAGTTWLQTQLEAHPSAFFATPKEIHYWDCIRAPYLTEFKYRIPQRFKIPDGNSSLRYQLSTLWHPEIRSRQELAREYQRLFEGEIFDHARYLEYLGQNQETHRLIGDFTPSYALLGKETFKEMHDCHPNAKFIFILRDPVKRLWSGIQQRYRAKVSTSNMTAEALCHVFKQAIGNPYDPDFLRSDYQLTITELEATVPRERIHYCFFEDLLGAERGVQSRKSLIGFIGLPDLELNTEQKVHSAAKPVNLPDSLAKDAYCALSHVYTYVSNRFDASLYASWLHL